MRYLKYVPSFLFTLMIMNSVCTFYTGPKATDLDVENVAKRNFLFKAREYLHSKPLSRDLRSFIRRVKKKTDNSKREVDKDHMYVVQNGDIIPLKDLASVTNSGESTGDFTVIPLIIPVTVRTYTESDGATHTAECSGSGMEAEAEENEANDDSSSEDNEEHVNARESADNDSDTTTTKEKVVLDKVINDFQDLITLEKEGQHSNEGTPCSVLGDWDSEAAGMQIRIEPGDGPRHLAVSLVEQEPAKEGGLLCNGDWDMYGQSPFPHSSLIILTGVSRTSKKLASFIGECRECEDAQTIVGNWMEGKSSKNCKDRLGSHTFLTDILKRNCVRSLQHSHLLEITTAATTVLPVSTSAANTNTTANANNNNTSSNNGTVFNNVTSQS